jgi:hypothetical protein
MPAYPGAKGCVKIVNAVALKYAEVLARCLWFDRLTIRRLVNQSKAPLSAIDGRFDKLSDREVTLHHLTAARRDRAAARWNRKVARQNREVTLRYRKAECRNRTVAIRNRTVARRNLEAERRNRKAARRNLAAECRNRDQRGGTVR